VGHWLQTEYDTAVIRAHQAADWQQFEREKDVLPNLKWMPSTSAHPGADHRVFWGTVRAINDPFWSSHRPGDRWNCKCSLSSTDEPVTQVPDAAPSDEPQNGLENNPGVDGKAFSDSHPYFPANCASCDFYKGSKEGFTNRVKNCYNCPYARNCLSRSEELLRNNKPSRTPNKQERIQIEADVKSWVKNNLPQVILPNGQIAKRLVKRAGNGDEVVINRKVFSESYNKNQNNKNLSLTMSTLTCIEEWIGDAYPDKEIEDGKHHNFDFKVYRADYKGMHILLKAKLTEGIIAYYMRLLDN
jgi:hypothetical protein